MILLINQVSWAYDSPSAAAAHLSTMSAQIGASALIGMSLFILITPLQTFFMKVGSSLQISHRLLMAADAVWYHADVFQGPSEFDGEDDVVEA
jgi:hypothetical protein